MLLLILFVLFALVFSFLCSIAEAVILSVSPAHVALLEQEGKPAGPVLRELKADINKPLAAILTLNTIAHTMGAAGAGAQAASVFGSAYLGLASAILTVLILIFSEIIPKTLGAHYWRQLAPITAHGLKWLTWLFYPFVIVAEKMTGGMLAETTPVGFSRREFTVMADLSYEEGLLAQRERVTLKNLLALRRMRTREVMTPRTVVFSVPEQMTVGAFVRQHEDIRFSRIPLFIGDPDHVHGFVLRAEVLLAQARGESERALGDYRRELPALPESATISQSFQQMVSAHAHIALVVDEYGDLQGILTLEDILETLLGLEIVDEGDTTVDMQELARSRWRDRASGLGVDEE
ncbi:MAG: HlyC/CorC family transporter [Xanthomonadales bacterium]|nr:HlyC/CorC family transporter [Xanthomonadales bacterium]